MSQSEKPQPKLTLYSDHLYKILIIGGSGSEKNNVLLNLTKHQQSDIDKIYLYFKDPFESKYESLLKGREKVGIKQTKNQNAFNDYSLTTDDLYENFEEYNPTKKVLIVFDDMTTDLKAHKKSHYY